MENKVLVTLFVPKIEQKFDVFIPINKTVGNIINICNKILSEKINANTDKIYNNFYDRNTGDLYDISKFIVETNIRNGSELILL